MRRVSLRIVWPVVLAVVTAGAACGGSSSALKSGPKPVSSVGQEWKVYAPAGGGYRIQIRSGWVTIDARTLADSRALHDLKARNAGLSRGFAALAAMARQPGVLVAFDGTSAGKQVTRKTGFAPNIIVRRIPLDPNQSDSDLLASALAQGRRNVESIPARMGSPSVSRLTIAGLPAGVVTYHLRETTVRGTALVSESDYVTVLDGTAYTIYCSTVASDVARLHPDCAHALASFSITG